MRTLTELLANLRAARLQRNLSQTDVASKVGTTQSAIARLEAGAADPRLSTVQRYAQAVGSELVAQQFPQGPTLQRTTDQIRESLAQSGPGEAFRHIVQFLDDTEHLPPDSVRAAIRDEPDPIGDRPWDCFAAGIAEYLAHRANLPTPGWASAPSRFLDRFWFAIEDILAKPAPGLAAAAFVSTPPELAARGVFVDRSSLVSV